MKYLLDTHIFLWSLFAPKKLNRNCAEVIQDQNNAIYISPITFWEISLKYSLGKIELKGIDPDALPKIAETMNFEVLPFSTEDAASFHQLPRLHHKDPFDRMIIWQAIRHGMTLITKDRGIRDYQHLGLMILQAPLGKSK